MRSWVAPACGLLALTSCGSRTGLLVTPGVEEAGAPQDASPPPTDAPIGEPIRYLVPSQAPEGVYTYALGEFDPLTGGFTPAIQLGCLAAVSDRPIAVAPRCDGTVFVQFAGGSLWRVESGTLACTILEPIYPGGPVTLTSGIGPADAELLYFVAGLVGSVPPGTQNAFGSVDPVTLAVTRIGSVPPRATLHSTADSTGRLFFYDEAGLEQIDESTGQTLAQTPVPAIGTTTAHPLAFWGGAFYFFSVDAMDSTDVVRWAPGDSATTPVGHSDLLVVAAGISPCAPLH